MAWHPLGWQPAAFAEIEKFPSAVLAHHYPHVPNLGDMTKFGEWPDDLRPDVLVGGTPCQSFSVAGLRKGMADPRGNLALTYLAIADRYRPEWLLWENVPGVLSSDGGRDFGSILGGMGELGYGFAYRVLDAQYVRVDEFGRAVPQRRRRVFVVGNSRDWRRAAAVLFERESLSWDSPPRRQSGQRTAGTLSSRPNGSGGLGTDFDLDGGLIANPLRAQSQHSHRADSDNMIAVPSTGDVAHCLNAGGMGRQDYETETVIAIAHAPAVSATLMGRSSRGGGQTNSPGNNADESLIAFDTTQITSPTCRSNPQPGDPCFTLSKGMHPPAIAFDSKASGRNGFAIGEISPTLRAMGHKDSHTNAGGQVAVAWAINSHAGAADADVSNRSHEGGGPVGLGIQEEAAYSLRAGRTQSVGTQWAVRRLTPTECERLQGFPDGYTDVPWRGKDRSPDGPRYKACGNSMAVNAMRWIGRRIEMVNEMTVQPALSISSNHETKDQANG